MASWKSSKRSVWPAANRAAAEFAGLPAPHGRAVCAVARRRPGIYRASRPRRDKLVARLGTPALVGRRILKAECKSRMLVVCRPSAKLQPDRRQQGGMIAEAISASGVVVCARPDFPGRGTDEAVVQALTAEPRTDPTVVAT